MMGCNENRFNRPGFTIRLNFPRPNATRAGAREMHWAPASRRARRFSSMRHPLQARSSVLEGISYDRCQLLMEAVSASRAKAV